MTKMRFQIGAVLTTVCGAIGALPLAAQLPTLDETSNLGYFAVSESREFRYGLTTQGKSEIKVLNEKGAKISAKLDIDLNVNIEEKMPDGKVVSRQVKVDSLESAQEPTAALESVVYKGKVTGDTEFEVSVSETRGGILLGGRLLDAASLKNPTRFSIDVKIPLTLPELKADPSKKDLKKHKEAIKDDEVQLKWINGGKTKVDANVDVEGASEEVTGPGIESAVIEFGAFRGREIELTASPNSKMTLSNKAKGPLSSGFTINWSADVAKDPDGKARLLIKIK